MTTAQIIKQKREGKSLSQAELAEAVGVSRGMIAQIERGTKMVTLPLAKELAEVFGCDVNALVPGN